MHLRLHRKCEEVPGLGRWQAEQGKVDLIKESLTESKSAENLIRSESCLTW